MKALQDNRPPARGRRRPILSLSLAAASMAGTAHAAAPSVGMFGSFFPAWLLCLFAAVISTVVLRVVFIAVGLDDILRWRVLVYMSMTVGLTFFLTYFLFGR
jgi:uncharacterized membrane protein